MLPLTIVWFFAKKMPRFFAMACDLIAILMLIFLLVGANNSSQVSTYLTSFRFSSKSPLYDIISTSFDAQNTTTGLQQVHVLAGYMGICVTGLPKAYAGDSTLCYNRKSVSSETLYQDLGVKVFNIRTPDTKSTANFTATMDLNILQLAQDSSVKIIHPYVLMAVIVLALLMFCATLCATVPKLPGKSYVNVFLLILSPVLTLLWGLGAMWTDVAIRAGKNYVPHASMGILKVETGTKASALAWAAFAFFIVNCLILWALYFRDRRALGKEIDKIRARNDRFDPKFHSDHSTLDSKH
ncbi:LAFA_0F04764g1_1 [Lachancea sp. 'fantastica']|nr:LAFA_0F04764g1_1 [Lachancea sp. 'fantastica']